MEDLLHKDDPGYKPINIYDDKGFDDYNEINDDDSLQEVLKQFTYVDAYKIMSTLEAVDEDEIAEQPSQDKVSEKLEEKMDFLMD